MAPFTSDRRARHWETNVARSVAAVAAAAEYPLLLAFEPKTDDVREAPVLRPLEARVKTKTRVAGSDPEALETSRIHFARAGLLERGMGPE